MLFKSATSTIALLAAAVTSVRAHGYVDSMTIGGKKYPGWRPFVDPYASPVPKTVVRKIADDGPIDINTPELMCNKGGKKGNGLTATVAAGQDVTWTMNVWPDDHKGPITVYMANCNGECDSFDGAGAVWFKIASTGLIDAKKFFWATDKLIQDGKSWTQKIPSNIKAGNYLMRFEILALHSAGQPQEYPSCSQLKVTGGGNGVPTKAELVSFPGAYKQGDKALFGDIWNQPKSWPQLGPNVAAFVSGGSGSGPAPSDPSPTESEPKPEPTASKAHTSASSSKPTPTHKTCKRKMALAKKNGHAAKREYMRSLGKRRL